MIDTFKGVYYVPETNEIIVLHKVQIKLLVNLETGVLAEGLVVTLEAPNVPPSKDVVVSSQNFSKFVYVGDF